MSDEIGDTKAPARYLSDDGIETVDRIRLKFISMHGRDTGDLVFIGWCIGNAMKYEDRTGRKKPIPDGLFQRILNILRWAKPTNLAVSELQAFQDADHDQEKAKWYRQMAKHVEETSCFAIPYEHASPDPRAQRPGFTPYNWPSS